MESHSAIPSAAIRRMSPDRPEYTLINRAAGNVRQATNASGDYAALGGFRRCWALAPNSA
eukprot:2649271-Alexandrium_andersonii.AAC.1